MGRFPLEELALRGVKADSIVLAASKTLVFLSPVAMVVRGYDDESAGLLFLTDHPLSRDVFMPQEVALLRPRLTGVVLATVRLLAH